MNIVSVLYGLVTAWGVGIETPKYDSLGTFSPEGFDSFEVRDYAASVAAETCSDSSNPSNSFMFLAGYIGVMSTPQNARSEKIAMTAPVVDYENAAGEDCMQFILPESVYGSDVTAAPAPTDPNVKLLARPEMLMAAVTFSGRPSKKDFAARLTKLRLAIKQMEDTDAGFGWTIKDPEHSEDYQYNDPFVPGPWRKNEVVVQLVKKD